MGHPLEHAHLRDRVQRAIDQAVGRGAAAMEPLGPDVEDLLDVITTLLRGGKRLRAAFAYWGYVAAGAGDSDTAISLGAAMELFQAGALIQDDVMDASDSRRGLPTAHRTLQARHRERGWDGEPQAFGYSGAMLAGNLCLAWSEETFELSGIKPERHAAARSMFDTMRTQLMGGQFLDIVESFRPWADLSTQQRAERAMRVVQYKSAKYSIEHPLVIGARAGGIDAENEAHLARYGLILGQAFQLRDDVLGVYGDPDVTGKPAGDDLREGKRTVLLAQALDSATPAQRRDLETLVGRADLSRDNVETLRAIIDQTGALGKIEALIAADAARARTALEASTIDETARVALDDLVALTTERDT